MTSALGVTRHTVRLRLTLLYGALFLVSSGVLLGITYWLVSKRPTVTGTTVRLGSGARGHRGTRGLVAHTEIATNRADLHQLLIGSGIALGVTAVLAVVIGWYLAGRALRPLRTITAAVQNISSTNLHRRLALSGPKDEVTDLGNTFDELLSRLEQAFASQRQFVANASHELRTPLALEQALLEAGLTDPGADVTSLRETCERVLVSSRQQERLIEALLTLARSERGLDRKELIDMGAVALEVVATHHAEADTRGIELNAACGSAPMLGDARLIERLVANLVDNALRYNAPAGRVEVKTRISGERAVLSVGNTGPVVLGTQVEKLFQPFQRLREARTGNGTGLGLGLSIVEAIATAHGGGVSARPKSGGGLTVVVTIPTSGTKVDPGGASSPRRPRAVPKSAPDSLPA
ncbi:MAG: HAMP domain-containing sensor histidine kinase [Candidatus Dormiibacterota bacterium]